MKIYSPQNQILSFHIICIEELNSFIYTTFFLFTKKYMKYYLKKKIICKLNDKTLITLKIFH